MAVRPVDGRIFNRRLYVAIGSILLVTVELYVCIFKGVAIEWFTEYAKIVMAIAGFIIGTLTVTDAIFDWRKK